MEKQVIVSPEELYVLGKLLDAQYIDYAYVAMVKDIGKSKVLFEKESIDSLVSKDLLEEDFSGNVVPKDETVDLFKPVFFEYLESALDICSLKDPKKIETTKFHFFDKHITMVKGNEDGMLEVESVELKDLETIISSLVASEAGDETADAFDKDDISRVIVAKSKRFSKGSIVSTYIESNNQIFKEDENGTPNRLKADEFKIDIAKVLVGVM